MKFKIQQILRFDLLFFARAIPQRNIRRWSKPFLSKKKDTFNDSIRQQCRKQNKYFYDILLNCTMEGRLYITVLIKINYILRYIVRDLLNQFQALDIFLVIYWNCCCNKFIFTFCRKNFKMRIGWNFHRPITVIYRPVFQQHIRSIWTFQIKLGNLPIFL